MTYDNWQGRIDYYITSVEPCEILLWGWSVIPAEFYPAPPIYRNILWTN